MSAAQSAEQTQHKTCPNTVAAGWTAPQSPAARVSSPAHGQGAAWRMRGIDVCRRTDSATTSDVRLVGGRLNRTHRSSLTGCSDPPPRNRSCWNTAVETRAPASRAQRAPAPPRRQTRQPGDPFRVRRQRGTLSPFQHARQCCPRQCTRAPRSHKQARNSAQYKIRPNSLGGRRKTADS